MTNPFMIFRIKMTFPIKTHDELIAQLKDFDPIKYAKTRNFVDGGVSRLSPYLTYGIITIPECIAVISEKYSVKEAEKFLMELVWKEFFVQVQMFEWSRITDEDFREEKTGISKKSLLPKSLFLGSTDTPWVDDSIQELNTTGRLHNHQRMRLASRCCHRAKLDRKLCADRTYYHFLDGELSSNHLSRQWVNSSFANKAYMMNEENLQKYRQWAIDEDLRGSYEEVSIRLFDEARVSTFWSEEDMKPTLTTNCSDFETVESCISSIQKYSTIKILSPWRLHPSIIDENTVVVLDETFLDRHPWSELRTGFVKSYCDHYEIPCVYWSYEWLIKACLDQNVSVTLDERFDPVYHEIQKKFASDVELISYPYLRRNSSDLVIPKFFKYWNKAKKHI